MKLILKQKTVAITVLELNRLKSRTVTIPQFEYLELKRQNEYYKDKIKRQCALEAVSTGSLPSDFRVKRDPEVEAFIRPRLGVDPIIKIVAACKAKFGAERAPSKSALSRYWLAEKHLQTAL